MSLALCKVFTKHSLCLLSLIGTRCQLKLEKCQDFREVRFISRGCFAVASFTSHWVMCSLINKYKLSLTSLLVITPGSTIADRKFVFLFIIFFVLFQWPLLATAHGV